MTRDQLQAVVWQHASNLSSLDPQDRAGAMTAILDAAFPLAMSLHFEKPVPESGPAEPVATCLVPGCHWYAYRDSLRDAANAWVAHLVGHHRSHWDDA